MALVQLRGEHYTKAHNRRARRSLTEAMSVAQLWVGCLGDGFVVLNAKPNAGSTLSASPTVHSEVQLVVGRVPA